MQRYQRRIFLGTRVIQLTTELPTYPPENTSVNPSMDLPDLASSMHASAHLITTPIMECQSKLLLGPSHVCKQSRNHRASTPSLKASGSKSPRGVRRVDVASTPVQSKSRHVISGLRKRSLTFRDQR